MTVNGHQSNVCRLEVGVPQGSILRPLLYITYVNDFPNSISFSARLYADDTCLVLHDNGLSQLEQKIISELKKLKTWFDRGSRALEGGG